MEEEVSEVGGYKIVGENEERDIASFQPLCSRFCLAAFLQSCETKSRTESLGSRLSEIRDRPGKKIQVRGRECWKD